MKTKRGNIPGKFLKNYCQLYRLTGVEKFVRFSIIWGAISSCVVLLMIKGGIRTNTIFALKDALIYLGALFVIKSWLSNQKSRFLLLLIVYELIYLFLNYAIINPNYNAPLNNIRQILGPLVLLLIFCQLRINERGQEMLLKVLCWTVICVFSFGLYEQVTAFWATVNLKIYFGLKGIPTDANGLSFMFYEPMFGYRERMTSTFLDPISLGHFFASAAIFLFYLKGKKRMVKVAFLCSLVGLFLALSKGAILQFFIGVILLNPKIYLIIRLSLASLPFIFFASVKNQTGILNHVSGFLNSIESLTLFGNGIGAVGNYAKMFSNDLTVYNKLGIADTYIGAVLGQIGLIGIIIWLSIAYSIIVYSAKTKAEELNALRMFLSIFIVSILSENTMNITSFLLPAIIISLSMQIKSSRIDNLNFNHHLNEE